MKKINTKILSFAIAMLFFACQTIAQTITPTAGATETFNVVGGELFTDPGGAGGGPTDDTPGNYPDCGCVTVTTLTAPAGDQVQLDFTAFEVFLDFDWVVIYDGSGAVTASNGTISGTNPSSSDPVLYNSFNSGDDLAAMTASTGTTFTSTGESLTIAFRSSTVVNFEGWEADVTVLGAMVPVPPTTGPCVATNVGLSCNDNIQVSVDANCQAVIGADMVLEGGGYCYDDYTVSINGGNDIVNPSMVGLTLSVEVTQISTGNSCWGTISVEDKIDPVIECACTPIATTTLSGSGTGTLFARPINGGTSCSTTTAADHEYDVIPFSVGTDGIYTMEGLAPSSDSYALIYEGSFDPTSPCTNHVFGDDDGSSLQFNDPSISVSLTAGTQYFLVTTTFGGGATLGDYSYDVAGAGAIGTTTDCDFACTDLDGILDGSIAGPSATATDGCGTVSVSHTDVLTFDGGDCGTSIVTRTYTATDGSGNTATCSVDLTFAPAVLADVVFPADVTIDCTENENDTYANGKLKTGEPTGVACNINVTKHDHIVEICEGSYKVLRTWKAVDWCADAPDNILEGTQIVKVLDTTGPSIGAIAALNISPSNSCTASTVLPALNVSDDCSGSDISVSYTATSGVITYNGNNDVYVIAGLELGSTTVTATATDACGNDSSIDFLINVADDVAPIAICDEHTIASIGSDGLVSIPALTFDDGSYDNCGIVEYKVRRMTDACNIPQQLGYGDYANFCCADIGSTVMVELRVRDAAGNTNSCMVEVEVQDKLAPTIVCPPNKTIDCDDDYADLGLTGEAIAFDNCDDVTPTFVDNVNINSCGEGTVTRIWSVSDASGNFASCVQFITVEVSDVFTIVDTECRTYPINNLIPAVGPHSSQDDVEWPCDIELTTCGNGLQPSDLEANYPLDARPAITEGYCDHIAMTYDDTTLPIQGDACLKILRNWIIIDWCNYDENNPYAGGRWEYVQVIKVLNSTAPQVFPGGDSYVGNFEENCGATYVELFVNATDDCTPTADLEYSYTIETASGIYVDGGSNTNASGAFANGEYVITWTVTDGCGNYFSADHPFKVEDKKKPTPVCINGLSTVIMPSSGAVTIWATDFEAGSSFDNCTPYSALQFSFSSDVTDTDRTFTCADIAAGNQVAVEIWVTDGNGNQDFCTTYILVQDPNGACPPTATAAVAGAIQTEEGDDVEEVTITLVGSNAAPIVTGANGAFNFPNMAGTNYVVTPEKTMNPLNGVSTFDLVLISKHILGTQALASPYKVIAADANASNTVTTFDIVTLRRLILQIDTEFANNNSWRFVASNYVFPDATNPFAEAFPETVNLATSNATDFVGVKVGDVNGSASPNNLLGTDTRTFAGDLVFQLEDKEVQAGEEFTIDFNAKDFNNTLGYQFTLGFDNAEFVDVATNLTNLDEANFGFTMLEEGIITTSWNSHKAVNVEDNATVFSLTFRATATANISDIVTINSRYTQAEAYNGSDLYNVALAFNGEVATADFKVYQNTPNPFKDVTTIGFNLPTQTTATLRVFDVSGKVLTSMEIEGAKGYNMVELNRGQLSATGVLYYQVETADHTATMKMILVD